MQKAQQMVGTFLSGHPNTEEARFCVPVLGLLGPQEQARLVQILLDPANQALHDFRGPEDAFEDFVPHLADLDRRLRAELATWAIRCRDDEAAAKAVGALGCGLAHLDEPSCDGLVDKAINLHEEKWRARAIGDLSAGLAHLNTRQRQSLWNAANLIQDGQHEGTAFAGLCAELKHLPPDQQDLLFHRVINLPDSWGRVTALAGLGASMETLDSGQRETLPTQALSLPDEFNRKTVVRALAAGVEHLNPDQRSRLVGAILDLQSAEATAALGPGFAHLTPEHQDQLLASAASLGPDERVTAIAGPAMALPFLEPACRDKVVALVLGMDPGDFMAEAIGALGPHLQHLEEHQRNTLAGQACDLLGNHAMGPDTVRALGAGLGAGMGALYNDQRDALLAAVAAMSPHRPPGRHNFNNLSAIAAAIAGLASGQQHLNEPQFQALARTALRLEGNLQLTRGLAAAARTPLA